MKQRSYMARPRRAAFFSLLAAVVVLAGCTSGDSDPNESDGEIDLGSPKGGGKEVASISWAIKDDPRAIDYAMAYDLDTLPVVTNVVESLLRFAPDGSLQPSLAESWEAVDPTTYVYQLRAGVKFHDGTEMTAADAEASLERIINPDTASVLSGFVVAVEDVEATGPLELTIKLSEPDTSFQYYVATTVGGVVPAAFLEEHGDEVGTSSVGIVGTGPYKFEEWRVGRDVTLAANEDYWNTERQPKVKSITFKIIESEPTIVQALGSGDVDGVFAIGGKQVDALERFDTVQVARGTSADMQGLVFNTTHPPFDKVEVRRALASVIDTEGILTSTWGGNGTPVAAMVPPAMWTFQQPKFEDAYDALLAKAPDASSAADAVADAGATGASATIYLRGGWREMGLIVQAAGKEIGLDLEIEVVPQDQYYSRLFSGEGDYDAFIGAWAGDFPDPVGILGPFFTPGKGLNLSVWDDSEAERLITESSSAVDEAERADLLIEAEARMVDQQIAVPFFSPYATMPLNRRLGGYEMNAMWYWDTWAADLSGV